MGIFGLGCGFAQSEYAVPFSVSVKSLKRPTASDDITIYILRGFQGLGPAAAVPASVGISLARVRSGKMTLSLAWYPRPNIPPINSPVYRLRHVLCWCSRRGGTGTHHWWCPYTANRVGFELLLADALANLPCSKSWRSTFWFMTGLSALCCVGGWISIEADIPYDLPDK